MSLDEHKRRERAQAIGLFRYRLICPALDEGLSTKQRGKLVREIAAEPHADPFGNQVRISRETLDRWIRRYRRGGFEALVPEPRRLAARTDTQVLELAASLKRENPTRTVAQVARILRTATGWAPSESTLLRHFHRVDLMGPGAGEAPAVFGRFEAADPNELWCGDALHGPRIGDRKTYLFAFVDDHSRLLPGYRFGFAEDTVRLAAALKPALAARGVPRAIYVDNGSAFVDAWLLRACAKLGVRLVHSTPGRPQGRGKIERFFRTVREQFLVEVTDTSSEDLAAAGVDHAAALLEMNRLFTAWVETEYHRRVHSETGQSPLARWQDGWDRLGRTPAMPTAADLTEAFLWSEHRTVTKTATVSLHANVYEVDPALVGRKVELVFSPFDLETLEVRYRGKSFGTATPHTISRHAHPKAKPETTAPQSPAQTGIDYLALTAVAHHEQLRRDERIGYHALYSTTHGHAADENPALSLDDDTVVVLDHTPATDGEVSA
ncbi:DDE-type integrase/transposase/recombinase [Rhodococcus opacus]|uniref:Putative transposase n=1 Tax=Rhodococcus opacus (strain B4) TaxID=632772 RepID=C1BE92_RHOOB|nr:DDE-type integrase/transposase/recombinase [Rhodococcus opacus]BAH56132.1 putative transposase [Rhodococcus opacus B4]